MNSEKHGRDRLMADELESVAQNDENCVRQLERGFVSAAVARAESLQGFRDEYPRGANAKARAWAVSSLRERYGSPREYQLAASPDAAVRLKLIRDGRLGRPCCSNVAYILQSDPVPEIAALAKARQDAGFGKSQTGEYEPKSPAVAANSQSNNLKI